MLPFLQFHDAGRFVEQFSAVFRLVAQDPVDLALADDRIAFLADTGIIEQFLHVLQTAEASVQKIFALAGAVYSSRDRHFIIVDGKHMIGIIDRQCDGGIAERLPVLCPGEDDILHIGATQRFGALFPEHPPHRIRDIALAAAVRSDDSHDSAVKFQRRLVRKGFESVGFDLFQIHSDYPVPYCFSSFVSICSAASCSACFLLRPSATHFR